MLATYQEQNPENLGCQVEVSGTGRSAGFYLYMMFLISYFLHLPARIEVLGAIRFDLLLVIAITFFIVISHTPPKNAPDEISKRLYILFAYILVSLPFVQWPGSVIGMNMVVFIKAVVFFFFTAYTVKTERDLKIFMLVFILCQSFRVFEPVWLHITTGYWGSSTHMGDFIMKDRLSGSPHDIINPNGLAWVIVSTLPFMYFLTLHRSFILKLLVLFASAVFIYALLLTESRSGMIGLAVVIGGIIWKSKYRVIWAAMVVLAAIIIFARLDSLSQERYLSIYREDVKGANTVELRKEGIIWGLKSVLNKPIVGHGLGTSKEVGANIAGYALVAHNLCVEVLQELGIIGFVIFFMYLKSTIKYFFMAKKMLLEKFHHADNFLVKMINAMQVWLVLAIVFNMASYGLSIYTWYFFGGISLVLLRLSEINYEDEISLECSNE